LMRTGASTDSALSLSPSAHVVLRGNVFAGFGTALIDGVAPARRSELLAGNIVVPDDDRSGVPAAFKGAGAGERGARPPAGRGANRTAAPGKGRRWAAKISRSSTRSRSAVGSSERCSARSGAAMAGPLPSS